MKKSSILIVFSILFLSSCGTIDYNMDQYFVVTNKSEHEIKLQVSEFVPRWRSQPVDTTFVLPVDSLFEYDYGVAIPFGPRTFDCTVIFDDTLSITYYRDFLRDTAFVVIDSSRLVQSRYNPLLLENYASRKISKCSYAYTYTFTEQDFKEAVKYNNSTKK